MTHLLNEVGRVLLRVRPFLDDPVEELAASDPGEGKEKVDMKYWSRSSSEMIVLI